MPHPWDGSPFIELQSVDSTNIYARQLIASANDGPGLHKTAIFAHEQTAGKGQRGKQWTAEKDANIALSVILKPGNLRLADQFLLTVSIALAVHSVFSEYAGDETRIKWPNDLYWRDRKAGGILIESVVSGTDWSWAIVGVGININQTTFPESLPNPVSLKQITGKNFDPVAIAREILDHILSRFERLQSPGSQEVLSEYNAALYKRGERMKFRKGPRTFEAELKGVTMDGKLVLLHAVEEKFVSGEIELLLPDNTTAKHS